MQAKASSARKRLLPLTAFAFDLFAVAVTWVASYLLRFEGRIPNDFMQSGLAILPVALVIHGTAFWRCGLYRGLWLFASLPDLMRIIKAVLLGGVINIIAVLVLHPLPTIPRTILFLAPLLELLMMGGARFTYRATKEFYRYGGLLAQGSPVLIIGAGQAAASLIRELARSAEWRLMGLLDDDRVKHGRDLQGWTILGPINQLSHWAEHYNVKHVIIAMPSAPLDIQKRVFSMCIDLGLKVMVLPSLAQIDEGMPFMSRVRHLDLEDLLGRDPVAIDTPQVAALLSGQVILVTGAGGSIGSELCRQIARFKPARLVAVDQSEFALYRIAEEFEHRYADVPFTSLAGDVKDEVFVEHLMRKEAPTAVFHAAAYKHVPLMEEANAWQAVRNNVLGTLRLGEASARQGVRRFVLISTDKAVNPTNVMGATKRLAEMVCQALQARHPATLFETVRFGNVLGSDGSVVPKFSEQIARGGPVTVTHPDITRYFMTIPEAAQLVLQASCMGEGGEIFLLDMGQTIKIVQLARDLIHLHGFTEQQIPIEFTGLRPGEKMFEELLADEETTRATHHPKLRIARARDVPADLLDTLLPWLTQARMAHEDETRQDLRSLIPEYSTASLKNDANIERLGNGQQVKH
jgi:FlaA1/EpsC-like NDP-sugar epimerase